MAKNTCETAQQEETPVRENLEHLGCAPPSCPKWPRLQQGPLHRCRTVSPDSSTVCLGCNGQATRQRRWCVCVWGGFPLAH